jgi:ATP-dependent RNA helicase DDX35
MSVWRIFAAPSRPAVKVLLPVGYRKSIFQDEAHERTTNVDILMGLLKKILRKRKDLRLIIASATVDAQYVRDFFDDGASKKTSKEKVESKASTILSVQGRSYSVDVHYLLDPCPNYVQSSVETVFKVSV